LSRESKGGGKDVMGKEYQEEKESHKEGGSEPKL